MPDLVMSSGVVRREHGELRRAELFNMYLERDGASPDGFSRQSRLGMRTRETLGAGPINGLFSKRGVYDDRLFTISQSTLYIGDAEVGAIDGDEAAIWAASSTEVVVTRGTSAWSYNGTDLAAIAFPDEADVQACAYLGGYFFFARKGTHRIYWSTSGDARTIDGLDYVSAESEPDAVLDLRVVNDALMAIGQNSTETFQLTGDADAVIARIEGLLLKKGVTLTGAAAELDNTLFFWGHDDYIYRAVQGPPLRVSDNTIEERLKDSVERSVFSFVWEGHAFLAVRCDDGTFVLDVSLPMPVWSEFGSYGRGNWRAVHSATPGGELVFGSDDDGRIFEFEAGNWTDGSYLERRMSASFDLVGSAIKVDRLCVLMNPGETPLLEGEGSDPEMDMRASRDGGKRWGYWRQANIGRQGKYRQRVEKRRWGLYDRQGGVFEFRVTDPVPVRISRVYVNESSGGRGVNE